MHWSLSGTGDAAGCRVRSLSFINITELSLFLILALISSHITTSLLLGHLLILQVVDTTPLLP
ncbi:hypothetical protein BJX96DRAFT_142027 [Aspergillus floccosus]